jgi:transposase
LSTADREQLTAIAADRKRPRKHVEQAHILLTSADRHSTQQIAQSIGVSRPTVWRWQQPFCRERDRGSAARQDPQARKAPIAAETAARVVVLTCTEAPPQATHWTGGAMAIGTVGVTTPHHNTHLSMPLKRIDLPEVEAVLRGV